MKIIRGFERLPVFPKQTIVALGNFDGVHEGHRAILNFVIDKAKGTSLISMLLTFSPHPETILGKKRVRLIQTLDQRLEEIRKFGLDSALIIPFDKAFSRLTAREFIQKILINLLKAKIVVVGENFRFGHDRGGDSRLLRQLASRYDLRVFSLPSVIKDGSTVSSSLIRSHLQEGQIEKANVLLGRPYEISGEVIRGQDRGKSIGFPTANIRTPNEILPRGVFVTRVNINAKTWPSVTNIGQRPTFGQKDIIIESYILGFNRDLYGKDITIQFLQKIREEIKFTSAQNLSDQIQKDIETAKSFFDQAAKRIP